MTDGDDPIDVDAPIPYVLTALGRRDAAFARAEALVASCAHEWEVDLHQGFVCRRCGDVAVPRRLQSIPQHLGLRDRK